MAYIVTAKVSRSGLRVNSLKFRTRAQAEAFANKTKKSRPGSNPRLRFVE